MNIGHKVTLWSVGLLLALATLLVLRQEVSVAAAKRDGAYPLQASAAAPTAPAPAAHIDIAFGGRNDLLIPVAGLEASDLVDTWGAARSEGRAHQGIDIMAARGTDVLAVADGSVARFFDSDRGGVTIYQFDREQRFIYYYAHLEARAPGLKEGDPIRRGQVLGYVGSTGNATTPHLHFEIQRADADGRWWRGEAINPYPFLRARRAPT